MLHNLAPSLDEKKKSKLEQLPQPLSNIVFHGLKEEEVQIFSHLSHDCKQKEINYKKTHRDLLAKLRRQEETEKKLTAENISKVNQKKREFEIQRLQKDNEDKERQRASEQTRAIDRAQIDAEEKEMIAEEKKQLNETIQAIRISNNLSQQERLLLQQQIAQLKQFLDHAQKEKENKPRLSQRIRYRGISRGLRELDNNDDFWSSFIEETYSCSLRLILLGVSEFLIFAFAVVVSGVSIAAAAPLLLMFPFIVAPLGIGCGLALLFISYWPVAFSIHPNTPQRFDGNLLSSFSSNIQGEFKNILSIFSFSEVEVTTVSIGKACKKVQEQYQKHKTSLENLSIFRQAPQTSIPLEQKDYITEALILQQRNT